MCSLRSLRRTVCAIITSAVLLGGSAAASADVVLQDVNAKVSFQPGGPVGITDWYVDGVNHLYQQWFWYRIGETGGEQPVHELPTTVYVATNTGGDPNNDHLVIHQEQANVISIEVSYDLIGGSHGSQSASMTETITITNLASYTQDIHFFQYCDFDLDEAAFKGPGGDDDYVVIVGGNAAKQGAESYSASEAVVTTAPTHYEVAVYPDQLDSLNDLDPTLLSDFAGPLGPDDVTWAFEWDVSLAAGQSLTIGKIKTISPDVFYVPEPSMVLLVIIGAGALMGRRRMPS